MLIMTEETLQEDPKSKSQIKREVLELKALGVELVKLSLQQLRKVPLDDQLRQAVELAKTITSNGAKRRQMQYIGKLMRDRDPQPIQQALNILNNQDQQANARLHRLEKYRDELINKGDDAIAYILTIFPTADRQILRQFIRKAQKEPATNRSTETARNLFRYLRDLSEEQEL